MYTQVWYLDTYFDELELHLYITQFKVTFLTGTY